MEKKKNSHNSKNMSKYFMNQTEGQTMVVQGREEPNL